MLIAPRNTFFNYLSSTFCSWSWFSCIYLSVLVCIAEVREKRFLSTYTGEESEIGFRGFLEDKIPFLAYAYEWMIVYIYGAIWGEKKKKKG